MAELRQAKRGLLIHFVSESLHVDEADVYLLEEEDEVPLLMAYALTSLSCRKTATRISNYFEITIPRYSDDTFKSHFRMSKTAFEELCQILAPLDIFTPELKGKPSVPVKKQLLIVLWYLANPEALRVVSDRFDQTNSCMSNCIERVCRAIKENIASDLIAWPNDIWPIPIQVTEFLEIWTFTPVIPCLTNVIHTFAKGCCYGLLTSFTLLRCWIKSLFFEVICYECPHMFLLEFRMSKLAFILFV